MQDIFQFAAIMFILSQVSERVSNLLKLYLPKSLCGNLALKEKKPRKEKIRERKIALISLFAGWFTTFLFYKFILDPAYKPSSPGSAKIPDWVRFPVENWVQGYTIISIFLSFGSKFWHDVLDLIFLYKNAQRVIQNEEYNQADNPDQISAMLRQGPADISRRALADNRDKLMKAPGVVATGIGENTAKDPGLRVYFEDSESAAKMKAYLIWTDDLGIPRNIPIEKIVSGKVISQALEVGGRVSNLNAVSTEGTCGFLFRDKAAPYTLYISSCYHVMKAEAHQWDSLGNVFENRTLCHDLDSTVCRVTSKMAMGYRNSRVDVALAQINQNDLAGLQNLPYVKKAAKMDADYTGKKVRIRTTSGDITGYIHEWQVSVTILYADGSEETFDDFFSIRRTAATAENVLEAATHSGDSGAGVFASGEALGMIVGGSSLLSYAMKVSVVEDQLGVQVIENPSIIQ